MFLRKLDRGNAYPAPSIPGPLALRVLTIDGKPWFVVRDLCAALDIHLGTTSKAPCVTVAVKGMGMSECQFRIIRFVNRGGFTSSSRVATVSELGLRKLVVAADKTKAAHFLDWADTVVFQRKRSEFPCVSRSSTVTNPTVNPIPGEIALPQTKGIIPRDEVPSLGSGPSETRDELTMSSLEIAERTGKEHKHVLADIRNMFQGVGEDEPRFRRIYRDSLNRDKLCYHLPEIYVLTLITGYSIPLRKAVIERWRELEAQVAAPPTPALPDFSDPVAAARAWADAMEKRVEAEKLAAQRIQQLAEAREEVRFAQEVIHENLEVGTIDEWRALRHIYLEHDEKIRLSYRAKKYHVDEGITVGKQHRVYKKPGEDPRDVYVNVYRLNLVDEAARELGIKFTPVRI